MKLASFEHNKTRIELNKFSLHNIKGEELTSYTISIDGQPFAKFDNQEKAGLYFNNLIDEYTKEYLPKE